MKMNKYLTENPLTYSDKPNEIYKSMTHKVYNFEGRPMVVLNHDKEEDSFRILFLDQVLEKITEELGFFNGKHEDFEDLYFSAHLSDDCAVVCRFSAGGESEELVHKVVDLYKLSQFVTANVKYYKELATRKKKRVIEEPISLIFFENTLDMGFLVC